MLRQFFFLSFALASAAGAATIHVPGDQPTIQAGIDAAGEGDTVLVAAGTYSGAGNHDLDFGGVDRVLVSEDGAAATVIDCQGAGRGLHFTSGESAASIVEGFTITGGSVTGTELGGGVRCAGSSAPTFVGCVISGNTTEQERGGGLACLASSPTLIDCTISGNTAGSDGGGVHCFQSAPLLSGCVISGNSASASGGGLYCYQSSPTLTQCTFSDNVAAEWGGGLRCAGASSPALEGCTISNNAADGGAGLSCWSACAPTLTACTIQHNSAVASGGGIHSHSSSPTASNCIISGNVAAIGAGAACSDASSTTLINCSIADNPASDQGGGIDCRDSAIAVTNTILWNNTPSQIEVSQSTFDVLYCDVEGGWVGATNIDEDPLFVDAVGGDYHLGDGSPCIDAGTSAGAPGVDFEGDSRPMGAGHDIGADEYRSVAVGGSEPAAAPARRLLGSPYPNPFNPRVTIPFELGAPGPVRLAIHDLRGGLVRILLSEERPAGKHARRWDGRDRTGDEVATGIYLVRLEAEGLREIRTLVLTR